MALQGEPGKDGVDGLPGANGAKVTSYFQCKYYFLFQYSIFLLISSKNIHIEEFSPISIFYFHFLQCITSDVKFGYGLY